MTADELALAVKERLHPEPYGREVQPCGTFDFLLMRSSALPGGRYAFAFHRLGDQPVDAAFTDARTQARRLCRSIWFLREVGGST